MWNSGGPLLAGCGCVWPPASRARVQTHPHPPSIPPRPTPPRAHAEHDRRESEARFQLQELTRGVAFYRRLGLEFDKIHDDKLRMVFTQVDPADPARRFAFTVWVTPAETYALDDVAPALPPGVAPALLAELNAGNDFSAFVQRMRRAFKALVEGGQ